MSRNQNNSLITAGGIATGLGLLAGLGYVAYELYQQYEEKQQQERREIPITPPKPKLCSICDDKYDSTLFKLGCGHKFHSQCLSAKYAQESVENPGVPYKCRTCRYHISQSEILVFTHRYQE